MLMHNSALYFVCLFVCLFVWSVILFIGVKGEVKQMEERYTRSVMSSWQKKGKVCSMGIKGLVNISSKKYLESV